MTAVPTAKEGRNFVLIMKFLVSIKISIFSNFCLLETIKFMMNWSHRKGGKLALAK